MDDLKVHDIVVQDQVRLAAGKAARTTHLTFYVGAHGPFMQDFLPPNNTQGDIQAFIQQKVADLRAITERQY
jgi:hypothetical protein